MFDPGDLRRCDPRELAAARQAAHQAAQWLSRSARANLDAVADDSHTNLGWDPDRGWLMGRPMGDAGFHWALDVPALALRARAGDESKTALSLGTRTDAEIGNWVDEQLAQAGLEPASTVEQPYTLDENLERYEQPAGGLTALAGWYSLSACALPRIADTLLRFDPGPSPVRTWPHHFDMATLVALESGDAETARSIGIGLSLGDESYAEPYLYVTPWPHLDPAALPPAPEGSAWHTEGFVSMILTASALLAGADPVAHLDRFFDRAVALSLERLGA